MSFVKLVAAELRVGEPVNSTLYSSDGELLLRKGSVIKSERLVQSLLERGVYRSLAESRTVETGKPLEPVNASPFNKMDAIYLRLRVVFKALLEGLPDWVQKTHSIIQEIQNICKAYPDAMLAVIHLHHTEKYTIYHPLDQAIFCEVVGAGLGIAEADRRSIIGAALTANISIIDLQDELHTQEAPLTAAQRQAIDAHPQKSYDVLQAAGIDDEVWLTAVLQHHENCDGSGYPNGVAADTITSAATLLAIADRYTAMVSSRTYRKPLTAKEALQAFFLQRQGIFNEDLALRCIKELGIYPPGSFVRLQNGETAVVIQRCQDNSMSPVVSSFASPRSGLYLNPFRRDCNCDEYAIQSHCNYNETDRLNLNILWGYV